MATVVNLNKHIQKYNSLTAPFSWCREQFGEVYAVGFGEFENARWKYGYGDFHFVHSEDAALFILRWL